MADNIIRLPIAERLCADCEFALMGSGGVFCRMYQEDIFDERLAADCEMYESHRLSEVVIGLRDRRG